MSDSTSTLKVLSPAECHELLRTRHVGRLGVMSRGFPLIIPVNYAMDQAVIVFRSRPGTKLNALGDAGVTFEVDHISDESHTGWSVLVRGVAEQVDLADPSAAVAQTVATGVTPWVPGGALSWVRITPQVITGRRIVRGEALPWWLDTAYSFG